ncbi:uncharacterized protein MONOS_539 [Monocercomonoides exilis]|uniref:uncharacterized protein n=1 Tax=Monocercomonoides exilis TaxID=2049356 RepID=UPI00355A1E8C|nr:hypothetical protein MONOS_539 [Monocercomonoides exilis]|eukprot:MONOS_539.1-p1 / transcript=MONOS_539.1 / gene=MONOS_539 / organism=Monocercomonoides_exilis_PA203 / gene_product=unspecified product / transcript_product=unspecified product / location=Mono_scaffold00008:230338-231807(+) / protein_length=318 / sequence_SO=supercontig / SO=protein_coding / is_pseudo=false
MYVKCENVVIQIGTELFQLDFMPPFVREFAMWGCTAQNYNDEQDLLLIVIECQSETIFASSSVDNASDTRQCGAMSEPCISLNVALLHIIPSVFSNLLIDKSAVVSKEASACDVSIKSLDAEGVRGNIVLNSSIRSKASILDSCLLNDTCVSRESLVSVECGDVNVEMNFLSISNTMIGDVCAVSMASNPSTFNLKQLSFINITLDSLSPIRLAVSSSPVLMELENCTNKKCASPSEKGSIAALADLVDACTSSSVFDGATSAPELRANDKRSKELCQWSGSMVDLQNCSGRIIDTTVPNSSKEGLSVSGGSISVQF